MVPDIDPSTYQAENVIYPKLSVRLAALWLDGLVFQLLYVLACTIEPRLATETMIFTAEVFGLAAFQLLCQLCAGITLGQRLAGIKLVTKDGGRPGAVDFAIRAAIRTMLGIGLVAWWPALRRQDRRGVHDQSSGLTMIRYRQTFLSRPIGSLFTRATPATDGSIAVSAGSGAMRAVSFLGVGAVMGAAATYFLAEPGIFPGRYQTHAEMNGAVLIKNDTWTGDSWAAARVAGVAGYSDWQKVGATTPVPDPARTAIPIPSSSQPVPEQHSPVVSEKEFVKRLDAPADPDGSLSSEIDLWNTVATHRVFLALNNDQKYYIADGFIQKHILPLKEFQRLPLDHQERITGTLSQGLAIESNLL